MTIVRKTIDEITPMNEERAADIKAMSDEEIDYSDIPPLDEDFFNKAKPVKREPRRKQIIEK